MLKIGCHLSSSAGYLAMGKDASKIGANTFAFFTRNPRGGSAKAINEADVARFNEYAAENGISPLHIKQGYAKCSSMLLGDAVVTADTGIYRTAAAHGIDALLISQGGVEIEKYDTGFIGGASGALGKGKTAVFGDIRSHPDGKKILAFARAHGEEIISLGKGALFDYGGIVRIDT